MGVWKEGVSFHQQLRAAAHCAEESVEAQKRQQLTLGHASDAGRCQAALNPPRAVLAKTELLCPACKILCDLAFASLIEP